MVHPNTTLLPHPLYEIKNLSQFNTDKGPGRETNVWFDIYRILQVNYCEICETDCQRFRIIFIEAMDTRTTLQATTWSRTEQIELFAVNIPRPLPKMMSGKHYNVAFRDGLLECAKAELTSPITAIDNTTFIIVHCIVIYGIKTKVLAYFDPRFTYNFLHSFVHNETQINKNSSIPLSG